jgi:hypothetical protein
VRPADCAKMSLDARAVSVETSNAHRYGRRAAPVTWSCGRPATFAGMDRRYPRPGAEFSPGGVTRELPPPLVGCLGQGSLNVLPVNGSATFTYLSGFNPKVDFVFKSAQFFWRKNYH